MSVVLDFGQGAGLASASGVRPFLPPLLAGALARADAGIDFTGSGWGFLESPAFLLGVFALALLSYGAERSGLDRRTLSLGLGGTAIVLGAVLFAGSVAAGDSSAWAGLAGGVACALLSYGAVSGLLEGARSRLDAGPAGLLSVYADGAALALAGLAIFVEPAGFLAVALFILLLVRGRRAGERKYAGLRILR